MKKQLRIILYGDTLVLAGMRLNLGANPAFEVVALNVSNIAGQEQPDERALFALQPDVVIFDTSLVQPKFLFNLNELKSGVQLIGIDPDRDQVQVWSGQQLHELSMQDLVSVLAKKDVQGERHGDAETLMQRRKNRQEE